MTNLLARRQFAPIYIWLDIAFLLVFATLLILKKKYMTVVVGLAAGVLYMIVDYGIFHLLTHSRSIYNGYSLFWVLLWMSMSYGFTNFTWIWLWMQKDKNLVSWSVMILLWWFVAPFLARLFSGDALPVIIERTTGKYHGIMAVILFAGYLTIIIYNLMQKDATKRVNILWLLAIGILVQLGWESALLAGGIRSAGLEGIDKLLPLVVNSALETNLGMPLIYPLFILYSSRFTETFARKNPVRSFTDRIAENNAERVRQKNDASPFL